MFADTTPWLNLWSFQRGHASSCIALQVAEISLQVAWSLAHNRCTAWDVHLQMAKMTNVTSTQLNRKSLVWNKPVQRTPLGSRCQASVVLRWWLQLFSYRLDALCHMHETMPNKHCLKTRPILINWFPYVIVSVPMVYREKELVDITDDFIALSLTKTVYTTLQLFNQCMLHSQNKKFETVVLWYLFFALVVTMIGYNCFVSTIN